MTVIRHKTPTEESFLIWMNNHSESYHSLGERLFYRFAQCISSYRVKNGLINHILNTEYWRLI